MRAVTKNNFILMKSKTFKCGASRLMRLIRMHGLTFARLWKKEKKKKKGKRKREEKKQKIPHSEVVQNVSFFDYIYRCINFISVFKNRFEIRILKVLAARRRRRGEKMEEEEKCMCVCVRRVNCVTCYGMATDLHVRGNICCHINFNYSAESLKQFGTIPLVCPGTAPKGSNEQS